MRISIINKITFLFILLIITLSASIGIYSLKYSKQALMAEFNNRANSLTNSLSIISESPVLFRDTEMLSNIGLGALNQRDVIFCEIRDENENILFWKGTKNKKCIQEYTAIIQTEKIKDDVSGDELALGTQGAKRLEKIGSIHLIFSLDSIQNRLKNIQQVIILIIVIGIIIGSIAIALLVKIVVGRPIDHLIVDTRVIAKGNLSYAIPVSTNDEIGSLAIAFNQMTKDLKVSQEHLVKAERMAAVAQIASEAAHEMRNSIQVISVGTYLLKQIIHEENPLILKTIKQIDGAVSRTSDFIDDLLHFSRPIELRIGLGNINNMINFAITELAESVLTGIEVERKLSDNIPEIPADFNRLKQVVLNLVKNAAEAMRGVENKRLEIRSEKESDFVKIIVSDTGEGMTQEQMAHLFEPFHTTKKKGVGLGLSICKRFVEAHDNGRIEVESELGKGTRFTVILKSN
ncbi:MAG: ATP-binding protein [bacterium]